MQFYRPTICFRRKKKNQATSQITNVHTKHNVKIIRHQNMCMLTQPDLNTSPLVGSCLPCLTPKCAVMKCVSSLSHSLHFFPFCYLHQGSTKRTLNIFRQFGERRREGNAARAVTAITREQDWATGGQHAVMSSPFRHAY